MAQDAFSAAVKLVDRCEKDGYLSSGMQQQTRILKQELRFLNTFLKYTAKQCIEFENMQAILTQITIVGKNVKKLHRLLDPSPTDGKQSSRFKSCHPCGMMRDRLSFVDADDGVRHVLDKIKLVKPEIREVQMKVSRLSSSGSGPGMSNELVVEFIDSLQEDLKELHGCKVDLLRLSSLREGFEVLQKKLSFLKALLSFTWKRCKEQDKLSQLFAHVQAMADLAAYLAYSCLTDEMDEGMARGLALELSHLVEKIDPVKPEIREIYVGVLKASKSSESMSNTGKRDETAVDFVDSLLGNTSELLRRDVMPVKDEIKILQEEVRSLRYYLKDAEKFAESGKSNDLSAHAEAMAIDAASVIYSLFEHEPNQEIADEMRLAVSKLLDDLKLGQLSQMNAPKVDEEMVGFEDQEEKVVEQLLWGSMQLQIVSIVGMPGLGKTFLAQKVYDNPVIKNHFYVRVWCSVSQVYDRKELLINLLTQVRQFSEEMSKSTDEDLAGDLHKSLKGQKYLIVLDDIWDIEAWHALRRSFPDDNTTSRIVFTSRSSKLALQAKPDSNLHQLRPFSDNESWKLLQRKIFQTETCPIELCEVGQQIAKSCNGLPLAVVVVAGLLSRTRKEEAKWREVAESLNSYIINDPQRQCMDILDLSYHSLPDYLKSCFLYFGAFPEDKKILAVKLTRLWVAEGFVPENQSNLEDMAEAYLMDLIDRNLIIASKGRSISGVKACLIHDLIRDFCLAKAKQENFLKLIEGCGKLHNVTSSKATIPSTCLTTRDQRRLIVHCREGERFRSGSSSLCVRSLLFFSPALIRLPPDEVSSIIHMFKLLRVLDLMCIKLKAIFHEGISSLAQLRYLAVSGSFHSLPPSIANLGNLETFLAGAALFDISPYTILNMTKLRHLHINYCTFLHDLRSDNSSQLDSLQTLSAPVVSYGDDDVEIMRRFPNLKKLKCLFRGSWDSSRKCYRLPVLDFLTKLESLNISYNGQMRYPCEFSLPSSIRKLTMSWFGLPWEQIAVIGKLPNLEVLKLLSEAFDGKEWNMGDGEFPKLKFLKLQFVKIRKWTASGDYFPPLERLILDKCIGLEEIPSCLEDISTLKMIHVYRCGDSLEASIKRIQEEQRDLGNEDLDIELKR